MSFLLRNRNNPRNVKNVRMVKTLGYSPMVRHLSDINNCYSPLFGLFPHVIPVLNHDTGPPNPAFPDQKVSNWQKLTELRTGKGAPNSETGGQHRAVGQRYPRTGPPVPLITVNNVRIRDVRTVRPERGTLVGIYTVNTRERHPGGYTSVLYPKEAPWWVYLSVIYPKEAPWWVLLTVIHPKEAPWWVLHPLYTRKRHPGGVYTILYTRKRHPGGYIPPYTPERGTLVGIYLPTMPP